MRVIGSDGNQIGIMSTRAALELARGEGLDLVEVAPDSNPPVCRIMDHGKYKYEQSKRARKARKKQHIMHLKELKVRPKIEEHDYRFKVKHAREFLECGNKVRLTMVFRGREATRMELGRRVLDRMANDLSDTSKIEKPSEAEGRKLVMVLVPKTSSR